MILDAVTKSLEVLLGGAVAENQLPFVTAHADHTPTAFSPGSSDGQTNGATPVTLVAAPAAATQRQVKFASIYNADTAPAVVAVRLNNAGTFRNVVKRTLAVGETLIYDGQAWALWPPVGEIHSRSHAVLDSADHSDVLTGAVAAGDVVVGNATPKWARLAKGTANYVLKAGASLLAWGQVAFSELTGALVTAQITDANVTGAKLATGPRVRTMALVVPGNPAAAAIQSVRLIVNAAGAITAIKSTCRVVVTSGTYTYDVNKNGTTLYTTQANRPTRISADGTGAKTHTAPDVTALAAGDVLDVDVDGVGVGISDMTLHVEYALA